MACIRLDRKPKTLSPIPYTFFFLPPSVVCPPSSVLCRLSSALRPSPISYHQRRKPQFRAPVFDAAADQHDRLFGIVESEEVQPGVILDYDENEQVVGIEFLNIFSRASKEQLSSIQFQRA